MRAGKAVAVDLGASSLRCVLGEWSDLGFFASVIRQVAHSPSQMNGRLIWDWPLITRFCDDALEFAVTEGAGSIGIDSWGVDIARIGPDGQAVSPPICYRDGHREAAAAALRPRAWELYQATGIIWQPFNTIAELAATDDTPWLMLPEALINRWLPGSGAHEMTNASSTQLMGVDGQWAGDAFNLIGRSRPGAPLAAPGEIVGERSGVQIVRVASHDTAAAVLGMGITEPGTAFLNLGSWALLGTILERPNISREAFDVGFSNERAVDGRFRFLKNIPGFHQANAVHAELGIDQPIGDWLDVEVDLGGETYDLHDSSLYQPPSMVEAIRALAGTPADWPALLLSSLAVAIVSEVERLRTLSSALLQTVVVAGGGQRLAGLLDAIRRGSGLTLVSGPAEATAIGNLACQRLAREQLTWPEAAALARTVNFR